jgi:hypothetical protein
MKAKLDRQKYLKLASDQGLNAAISALHTEMNKIEHESFEGAKGWQPELWESIKEYRTFSSELWAMRDVNEAMDPTAKA